MAHFRDEAVILKSRDLNEADKMLVLFGRRRGKFRVIAKSVRKLTSRKRGHVETFNMCKVFCAEGKSLDIILEAEAYYTFDSEGVDRREFDRVGFVAMTFDKLLPEEIPEKMLYEKWAEYVQGDRSDENTRDVILFILETLGFIGDHQFDKYMSEDAAKDVVRLKSLVGKIVEGA